jgi:outer membrane protein assembly factor BamB
MTPDNEYFTSDQIDEQIEHLHQQNTSHEQTAEAQLVDMLQRHHRVSLVPEDRAALAHARQRILDGLGHNALSDHTSLPVRGSEIRQIAHPQRVRRARFLSSLAAVLVVGVLLGSWLLVTHMATSSRPASGTVQKKSLYTIHSSIAYRLDGITGKVIWQHSVPTKKQSDPNYGGIASLQVINAVVYAVLDFDIYALDARSGKQLWHITNTSQKAYLSFDVDQERVYLFSADDTFSALDATNGALLWHNTTFLQQNSLEFHVLHGNLYTEISGPASGDQKLVALDSATGNVRWKYPLADGSLSGFPFVAHGVAYFSSGNILSAVNEQSGKTIWETSVSAVRGFEILFVENDILYTNGYTTYPFNRINEAIYALAAHTGHILWTSDPAFNAFRLPITGGLLLAWGQRNGSYSIAGVDIRTGKAAWQVHLTCNFISRGVENPQILNPSCSVSWSDVIQGKWYVLESDSQPQKGGHGFQEINTLKSFDPGTGHLLSEHPLESSQDNLEAMGASNGLLYVNIGVPRTANTIPYTDTIVVAYSLLDATQAWHYVLPPFPAPRGANTSPNTSGVVFAP